MRRPTAIGTLVERSELVMLLHLPHDTRWTLSLTLGRGPEMHDWEHASIDAGSKCSS
ncbi:MAG TPA: hypothetical protein VIM47_05610 [Dermatophilaceae bacterium]